MGRDAALKSRGISCALQSPRPCGARQSADSAVRSQNHFNPRAPVGRDAVISPINPSPIDFNPRAPVGRDDRRFWCFRSMSNFNPRAPVGRDLTYPVDVNGIVYFNPRAPVGRDKRNTALYRAAGISIPAPLWGATNSVRFKIVRGLFQSPRPCGARPRETCGNTAALNFNPRAPVGRDNVGACGRSGKRISIPAPLWGATLIVSGVVIDCQFQSPRPCGARPSNIITSTSLASFQSPRPCGARRRRLAIHHPRGLISIPAPPWGATPPPELMWMSISISIPAPLWGATVGAETSVPHANISIPAPLWGATFQLFILDLFHAYFNPRAPVGRDIVNARAIEFLKNFNPRAPVGRDSHSRPSPRARFHFNPRAPVGRDTRTPSCFRWVAHISIPAPLWGATQYCARMDSAYSAFQSPRPCGARRLDFTAKTSSDAFQSPRPCGARRPTSVSQSTRRTNFNPRAPVGRDLDSRVNPTHE